MSSHPARIRSERLVRGGRRIDLELSVGGAGVPATLLLPAAAGTPAPGALLLHGYTSDRERMVGSAGASLLARGIASIAIDLPLHGAREERVDADLWRNPLGLVRHWQAAQSDCAAALDCVASRPEVDAGRLALVGYSLGAYLGLIVASGDARVRALVLAAGGDLPSGIPLLPLLRTVVDPLRAVRRLAGRPLLMVNGRHDRTILPDQAERLYAAAAAPRELQWYDGGHWLPNAAVDRAAAWLAEHLRAPEAPRRAAP